MANKKTIWKWMVTGLWICLGAGACVLLVAAVRKKDAKPCKAVQIKIDISGPEHIAFVDNKDVMTVIVRIAGRQPEGKMVSSFNLRSMEAELKKDVWIRNAELFFDNNQVLHVTINEREPVARVFTTASNTFYLDTAITRLPLSEENAATLPVFTNFPENNNVLTHADSLLMKEIVTISAAIGKDPFRSALIEQVDITPQRKFEMVPKVGNYIIVFGDASDADEKFDRLKLFYKNILPKAGLSYYSSVSVQYRNQVVAKKRGAEDVTADSLKTLMLMQMIADDAARRSEDSALSQVQDNGSSSTDSSMIQQSIERGDETNNNAFNPADTVARSNNKPKPQAPVTTPVLNIPNNKPPVKPATQPKPANNKPVMQNPKPKPKPPPKPVPKPKPKVTMPPKNDF